MIIITPTLPPHPGGVADYSALLAAHWPEPAAARSWIVAEGGAASRKAFPDWSIVAVDELSGGWVEALAGAGSGTVLVNYAQYGFSRAGMPFGLVGALLKWRAGEGRGGPTESFRADGARRLGVYFHETWLTGPWWRRRGLVAPVARRLARRLAVGADAVVTNCARHAKQLQPVVRGPVTVLPVPPNIRPAAEELTRAESRRAVALPAEEISAELLAADLGLSAYAEDALGKSGTVAALWAHGCPVGFAGHNGGEAGWNLGWSVERKAPADWAAFIEDDERRRRAGLVRREQIDAGDWTAHASRLRGFM